LEEGQGAATSAGTSLRDGEVTERRHGCQNNFFSLWTPPKNRTTVEVEINTSAPSFYDGSAWRCTGEFYPFASAANHRNSISACRRDDLGVANSNVTSKSMDPSVRSIPVPYEGACGEQKSPRMQEDHTARS
jgi:hypothetical protein